MSEDKLQISVSLPADLVGRADEIAALVHRDRNWVLQRALERYLADEGTDLREEAAGIAELDNGHSSDLDSVLKKAADVIDRAEARKASRAG
ncbi:ribbon-helix-helix protein, CopG family [Neorhizobium sp. NCHU2750]|uniref:CopG family ribbon-helix-helix protein n=1 Tax=Neorhizobium sp. NCHU2750 TaxID=1825976 RepID=UPI000EB62FBA|nr:transcriptional regulator [Neorhizobium sp. NCHU2750]